MSFKLPGPPSTTAKPMEFADWAEYEASARGVVSLPSLVDDMVREVENIDDVGCESEEEDIETLSIEASREIERRAKCCQHYPFKLESNGTRVVMARESPIYKFLLYATRHHMNAARLDGVDGTELFEELSSLVLRAYLGASAQSFVFGTATRGSFQTKVEDLCSKLKEGRGVRQHEWTHSKDRHLDVVGWIPFPDLASGKLIVFGQCKTGDSWRSGIDISFLNDFGGNFVSDNFDSSPNIGIFVASVVDEFAALTRRYRSLVFDRLRITGLAESVDVELLRRISAWNASVESYHR